MAEDKGKTTGTAIDPKVSAASAEGVKKLADAQRDFTAAVRPNLKAFEDWNLDVQTATGSQEKLTSVLREQLIAIKNQAREVGSLQSQFKDLGGAVTGFLGTLKTMISFTQVMDETFKKVQAGQKNYMSSLQANTSKLGQVTAESTAQIDAHKDALDAARRTAIDYNLSTEETLENFGKLNAQFGSMAKAYGNQGAVIAKLGRNITQVSRFFGVDFAEVQELVTSRLANSTMGLESVRKELMAVSRIADDYSKKLEGMGRTALQAGSATRQGFLKVLQEIDQMFKGGMNTAAEGFAKTTSSIMLKAKEMGFTPNEAQGMASSFGKVFGDMARFDNIFGARVAQKLGDVIKDIGSIQDESLRKRMEPYAARAKAGTLNVVDLKGIADAARGSSEGMRLLIKTFADSGMNPDVMRSVMGEAMGPGQQHMADAMVGMLQKGDLEGAFKAVGVSKEQAAAEEESKKKEQNIWEMGFEEFNKQASATNRAAYNSAIALHEIQEEIKKFFARYPYIMMGIMAAAQLGVGAVGRLAGGVLGKISPAAAGFMGYGGTAAASTAATVAPTAVAGAAGLTGGAAIGALIAAPLASAAVALGVHTLSKKVISRFASADTKEAMGKAEGNASLGDYVYVKAFGPLKGEFTRFRGVLTNSHRQEYKKLSEQVDWAKKNWDKLGSAEKQQAKDAEKLRDKLGKFIDQNTETDEQRENASKEDTAKAAKQLLEASGTGNKIVDKASLERAIIDAVGGSGRVRGASGTDLAAISAEFMAKKGKSWAEMGQGTTEADVKRLLDRELLMRQVAYGSGKEQDYTKNFEGGAERARMASLMITEAMTAGSASLSKSGVGTMEMAATLSKSGGGGGNTITIASGGSEGVQEMKPDASGNVRVKNPDTILNVNPLVPYNAAKANADRYKNK